MQKEKNVLISIIMGIYNCEKYLEESIESIVNQTYDNWELIMCDDGSDDKTLEIAEEYKKKYPKKIIVIQNERNMGLNFTLNHCLEYAKGEYIARQDGDDISLPNRLETEIKFLKENPNYSLVSSNMVFFDENGDWGESKNFGEVKKENFIYGSPICHAPCMMKKEALQAVGGYSVDKKLLRVEDYHLWFKFFIKGYKCYNLSEVLYKMRDDKGAFKRRNFRNRLNETRLKLWGFKKINIPFKHYVWAFKPIIAFFLPKKIYQSLHRKNMKPLNDKKIKVAHFVGSMNCGGTETMLMNLLKNINKEKYEFVFIENVNEKSWYSDEILALGGRIVKVPNFSMKNIKHYISELKKVFISEKFDVIHSHVFLHSGIVMLAAKKARIPIRIAHSHSAMRNEDNSFVKMMILRRLILNNATDLLACSTEAGNCLFGKSFMKRGKVLPNPIQLSKIEKINKQDVETLRDIYKITEDCFVIGHVGRLVEIKNHQFMLEMARILNEKNFKFKMFFLGDGPLKDEISKKIKEFNLTDKVIMTGNVKNVYEYMNLFDVLLLPSFYEGLPVTLVESQASGLYSLVSDKVSKEADLGLNLITFKDINNIDDWIDAILHFQKVSVSFTRIKKCIIENKFDADTSVIEYEKIYRK